MSLIGISGKMGSGKDTVGQIIQYLDYCKRIEDDGTVLPSHSLNTFLNDKLPDYYQHNWEIKKFAYKVKQIASILTGIPVEKFEDQEFKKQTLGEEWWYWKMYLDIKFEHFNMIPYSGESNIYEALGETPDEYAGHILVKPTVRELLQRIGTEAIREQIHPNAWVNALFADYHQFRSDGNNMKWIITDVRFPNETQAIKDRGGILIRISRSYKSDMHGNHPSETALDDWKDWDYIINNNGTIEDLIKKVKGILKLEKII